MPEPRESFFDRRVAMLIDGDNAQASLLEQMIAEASKYGLVSIRRIYGDWTTTNMNSWKESLNIHAIQPIQQFRYTVGKNATDSSMIIDAMDILYSGIVTAFCLVASDSDYTRLATRIREKGLFVMGIGRKETPKPFQNACDIFVYVENLAPAKPAMDQEVSPQDSLPQADSSPLPLLKQVVETSLQDNGWAYLGTVGNRLHQLDPSFDVRTYGYKQLRQLFKAHKNDFVLREEKGQDGTSRIFIQPRVKTLKKRV